MKKIIKNLLLKFGYKIEKLNPFITQQAFRDQLILAGSNPITIFDVGAFGGETALQYNRLFKGSKIYSFEPFSPSFEQLKKNTILFKNINVFNTAISNKTGEIVFHVNNFTQTNSILATHPDGSKNWSEGLLDTIKEIKVNSITLDDFISQNKIEKIDILKLDTQGTEYQILEGANKSIGQNIISLIYLEIIIKPTYTKQKNFDEILFLLRNMGFELYNFYNYSYNDLGELRQVDAIFNRKKAAVN